MSDFLGDDPFRKLQEQMRAIDPFLKLEEQMRANDPFLKLEEQMRANDPFLKLQEQMRASDPFLKLQEQMRANDPFLKLQERMRANDPFLKLQEQMRANDPFLKLQEQMRANDPFLKLQEQMRANDPFLKLQEQMRANDPFLKLQEQMRANDPFLKLQEQMRANDPFLKLQEQMRANDPFLKLQEQMRANDPFLKLQGQLRRSNSPQQSISLQLATAFAFVAEQESIIDLSLADGSNSTSVDPFQKFYLFVQSLYDAIREQIQAAQSVSELFKIHNLITTIISAAALYYAMQSANTEDVDKLRFSVDRQTDVIREEASASRLQMQETISALSQSVQQMTAVKAAALGYAVPYSVKRAVQVRAAKAIKAETVGAISIGQVVFVLGYEKKWVRIEAVDLSTGQTVSGWVVKKYLTRIK